MKLLKRMLSLIIIIIIFLLTLFYFVIYMNITDRHKPFIKYINKYSQEYKVDKNIIAAIVKIESDFTPEAISQANARGLMQIIPDTGKWVANKLGEEFNLDKLLNPEVNIKYGTYYLSWLIDYYENNLDYAVMAYNAGFGNVDTWIKEGLVKNKNYDNIPFEETKNYINKFNRIYNSNKKIFNSYYTNESNNKWKISFDILLDYLKSIFK